MSIFSSCGGVREDNLFFSRRCIIQQACWCWCVGVGGGVGVGVWVWVVVLVLVVMLFFFVDVDGVGVGACFAAVLTWVLLTSAVLILFARALGSSIYSIKYRYFIRFVISSVAAVAMEWWRTLNSSDLIFASFRCIWFLCASHGEQ